MSRKDLLSLSGHPGGGSSSAFSLHLAESIKYISAKRYTATVEHIKQNASMSSLLLFSSLLSCHKLFNISRSAELRLRLLSFHVLAVSLIWPSLHHLPLLNTLSTSLFLTVVWSHPHPFPFTRVAFTPSQTKLTERIRVMTEQFPLISGLLGS